MRPLFCLNHGFQNWSPGLGACVVNWSSFLTPSRRQQLKTTVLRYAEPCEHLSPELQEREKRLYLGELILVPYSSI